MTYQETVQYLASFINYERIIAYPYKESLKLEGLGDFLKIIGNPQDDIKYIHIAGTKGKGSTCVFVTYILREAGYKIGLYTSPHLSDFRERIRILNPLPVRQAGRQANPKSEFEGIITKNGLIRLVEKLKPAIDKYNKISKYGALSFFEIYTALAFVYFKEKKVDFAVLETGLGGRLDATNMVNPLVCAVTSLSYEHTQNLGNTLKEIAGEKAGIIKSSVLTVISAPQKKEARDVIRNKCVQVGVKLFEVDKDIIFKETKNAFNIKGIFGEYPNLKIQLLGRHQLINASVAVGIIEALRFRNIRINKNSIKKGLNNTVWPGRCEIIAKNPIIVLDGAQNIASAMALKDTIKNNFKYRKLILVLGISRDKDIKGICQVLKSLADKVILTKSGNPRAIKPEILSRYFREKENYITANVKQALDLVNKKANSEDLILVTGSLFVVGEARSLII